MLTGTPLDLTPFGAVLTGIGWLYWIVALVAAFYAARGRASWPGRAIVALLVLGVFVGPVGWQAWKANEARARQQALTEAAEAVFRARCAEAKTIVRRVVENVDGVWLTKVRPETSFRDKGDRLWDLAGLPHDHGGDSYIMSFLFWEHGTDGHDRRGYLSSAISSFPGYRFVDVAEMSGAVFRYALASPPKADLARSTLSGPGARYSVSYKDLDDPEARDHWIAGLQVRIADRLTGEQIAEKTWYSMEPGRGATDHARTPWSFSVTCPKLTVPTGAEIRLFVDQVLRPAR